MLLVAEKIRRKIEGPKVIIQIADEHALSNCLVAPEIITNQANVVKTKLEKILKNLQLDNFEILVSSKVDKTQIKDELKRKVKNSNFFHSVMSKCSPRAILIKQSKARNFSQVKTV